MLQRNSVGKRPIVTSIKMGFSLYFACDEVGKICLIILLFPYIDQALIRHCFFGVRSLMSARRVTIAQYIGRGERGQK